TPSPAAATGSGVMSPADQVFSADGIYTSSALTVTDVAGNVSAPANTFAIKIDQTARTLMAARDLQTYATAHSGWNNTDVTVMFTADDGSGSGVSSPADHVFSAAGIYTSSPLTVTDVA